MRPEPQASPVVSELLRRALAGRLGEVREALRAVAVPKAGQDADGPGAGRTDVVGPGEHARAGGAAPAPGAPEESLRRLMVTALPRMRDAPDRGGRALFFSLLSDLEAPARSADLRFLDAWNNAGEVLLAWPRGELDRDDARRALESYASLLELHLSLLGGRP